MTFKFNLATFVAVLHSLAGVAGLVLTPVFGSSLSASAQTALLAVSGLLASIGAYHVGSVAVATAKANITPALPAAPPTVANVLNAPVPQV